MSTIDIPVSTISQDQTRTFGPKPIQGYGTGGFGGEITVTVRFDDRCQNGHNTFSITADVTSMESRARRDTEACGCLHDLIAEHFPELASLIQWHLCSTDGPLHYVENTMYWLGRRGFTKWHAAKAGRPPQPNDPPNFDYAKKSAIWFDMPAGYVITDTLISNAEVEDALAKRLPALLAKLHATIAALELVW